MDIDIITKQDLHSFRKELMQELKLLFSKAMPAKQKQWLKSAEVRKLLKISPGTLQNLRINGTLRFSRVGSIIYYPYEDIERILEENQVDNSLQPPTDIDQRQTSLPFPEVQNVKL